MDPAHERIIEAFRADMRHLMQTTEFTISEIAELFILCDDIVERWVGEGKLIEDDDVDRFLIIFEFLLANTEAQRLAVEAVEAIRVKVGAKRLVKDANDTGTTSVAQELNRIVKQRYEELSEA